MKLSKSFLSEYIDITDINYNELAEKMVFAGNEYESIEAISSANNLVIGEILECVKHPESNKLSVCQVDVKNEVLQIVCGAPNVVDAKKVIVALPGANICGIEIKKATLAGVESNGMICSLAELELDSKFLSDEDKDGIHKLSDDAPVGEDAIEYLGFDDVTIDFELTANRADLLSILGMAYEVGAIYNKEIKEPLIKYNEIDSNIKDEITLEVKTDKCPIYLGKLVKDIEIKESPNFIKTRLMASGIRPINNVVDISNYVMLEYGQPLHFFDKDLLGNKVIVRNASNDEEVETLDRINRTLSEEDIVITNEKEIACIAGVMGSSSTEVNQFTKNIFIEAAIFDANSIRNTSKKVLRSEASSRYEKGIDPNRVEKAINRACQLLQMYANGKVCTGMLTHDLINKEEKNIDIKLSKINDVLGLNLTIKDVENVFSKLQFKTESNDKDIKVTVPTRRIDISIKEDLIEEVGRIYGYEHVVGKLPIASVKKGGYSKSGAYVRTIRNQMSKLGLSQVITYSLISEKQTKMFDKNYEYIKLLSPMSEDRSMMRQSLLPSLIDVYNYNTARGNKDILIYETSNVYYNENNETKENIILSGLLSGEYINNSWNQAKIKVDFYTVKGIVENLLNYLGFASRYKFITEKVSNMHDYRTAKILIDRNEVGIIGQIHPNTCKKEVYIFELNVTELLKIKVRNIKYKELSKFPAVKKDVAFIVKKDIEAKDIKEVITRTSRMLTEVEVFDVYTGENLENDEKSIAFSLKFQDMNKTLTDEEVTDVFKKIISNVETKLNAVVRDK